MDTTTLPPLGDEAWAENYKASLQSHRDGVREFLAAQQERLERVETVLEEHIDLLEKRVEEAESHQGQNSHSSPSFGPSGSRTWEEEKRRILAMLEGGLDGDEATQTEQRLKIEDVVQSTDQAIADKDREIAELKKRLETQELDFAHDESGVPAEQAVEQIDLSEVIDKDAVIQEERKKLAQLQDQWQEKLRQAEVELSMERAQLARLRAELEGKARAAEESLPKQPTESAGTETPDQRAGSRWLSRLGLSEADRERKRR